MPHALRGKINQPRMQIRSKVIKMEISVPSWKHGRIIQNEKILINLHVLLLWRLNKRTGEKH